MKIERPQFELTRVYADGTKDAPEIVPVTRMPWDTKMERRGFLGVGVGVASVLVLSTSACSSINKAHNFFVSALAISPDGMILASGSLEDNIKLWSLPEGKLLATLEVHKDFFGVLAISPDGKTLASGSRHDIKLWSLPDGKPLATLEGTKTSVDALTISREGKTLVTGSEHGIELWSLLDGKFLATLEGRHDTTYNRVVMSSDGNILASTINVWRNRESIAHTIKLWSLPMGKLLSTLEGHREPIHSLAISPDGKALASASLTAVKLWSLPDGKLLSTFEGWKDPAALAISPDGKTLVTGSKDGIELWSLPGGKLLAPFEGHKKSIHSLAISPDGKTLVTGEDEGVVTLWDMENKSSRASLFDPKVKQYEPSAPGNPGNSGGSTSGGGGGCTCVPVCTCVPISDRNVKEAFETTDPLSILKRLSELPIQTWNYKWNDAAIRHIGPMAQDFAAAFAVGEDDKHICPVDAQGVAFAAIQGLYKIVQEKDAQTEHLQAQLQQQREENQVLKHRIEALERLVMPLA